jgi:hypothetical protein
MRITYRVLNVPTKGGGAWLPNFTFGGAPATVGQNQAGIVGMPGTVAIPSPRPAALDDSSLGGPYNQPSAVAPNWITPGIYYYKPNRSMRFPGKVKSDNPLPVPVINPGRSAQALFTRSRVGGRTATAAIRPFTNWPTYGRGY